MFSATKDLAPGGETDPEKLFELKTRIGKGQFGIVYKALHRATGKEMAVKVIELSDGDDQTSIAKEVRLISQCTSPFIVQHYGTFFKKPSIWIVMEFCNAGSVSDVMKKMGKPLTENLCAAIIKQIMIAVNYIHSVSICHRDIKCGNILLNSRGDAKLADFGVAAQVTSSVQNLNTQIGSPYWMAPEMLPTDANQREAKYDMKVDIWALGITAIEMVQMKPPLLDLGAVRAMFHISTKEPPTVDDPSKYSKELLAFLRSCLQKLPPMRYTARDLMNHPFVTGAPDKSVIADFLESGFHFAELERASGTKLSWMDVLTELKDAPYPRYEHDYAVTLQITSTSGNSPSGTGTGPGVLSIFKTLSKKTHKEKLDKDKHHRRTESSSSTSSSPQTTSAAFVSASSFSAERFLATANGLPSSPKDGFSVLSQPSSASPFQRNTDSTSAISDNSPSGSIVSSASGSNISSKANSRDQSRERAATTTGRSAASKLPMMIFPLTGSSSKTNIFLEKGPTPPLPSPGANQSPSTAATSHALPLSGVVTPPLAATSPPSSISGSSALSSSGHIPTMKISTGGVALSPPQSPPRAVPVARPVSPRTLDMYAAALAATRKMSAQNFNLALASGRTAPPPLPSYQGDLRRAREFSPPLSPHGPVPSVNYHFPLPPAAVSPSTSAAPVSSGSGNAPITVPPSAGGSTRTDRQAATPSPPGVVHFPQSLHGAAERDSRSSPSSTVSGTSSTGRPTPLRMSQPIYHSGCAIRDPNWQTFFIACEFSLSQAQQLSDLFAQHEIELTQAEDLTAETLSALGIAQADANRILNRISAATKDSSSDDGMMFKM